MKYLYSRVGKYRTVKSSKMATADESRRVSEEKAISELKDCSELNALKLPSWNSLINVIGEYWYSYAAMQEVACALRTFVQIGGLSPTNIHVRFKLEKLTAIGSGATGKVYMSRDGHLAVKTSLALDDNENLTHEYYLATRCLNSLRREIPNFAMILARFNCSLPITAPDSTAVGYCRSNVNSRAGTTVSWTDPKYAKSPQHLIYENVTPNKSFEEYISKVKPDVLLSAFYQIVLALNTAYSKCKFTHYDLNRRNIVVRLLPSVDSFFIPYYHPRRGKVLCIADAIMTIIDYGYSYIETATITKAGSAPVIERRGVTGLTNYSIFPDKPFPAHDTYKLVIVIAQYLSAINPKYKSEQLDICRRILRFFTDLEMEKIIESAVPFAFPVPSAINFGITHRQLLDFMDKEFEKELRGIIYPDSDDIRPYIVKDLKIPIFDVAAGTVDISRIDKMIYDPQSEKTDPDGPIRAGLLKRGVETLHDVSQRPGFKLSDTEYKLLNQDWIAKVGSWLEDCRIQSNLVYELKWVPMPDNIIPEKRPIVEAAYLKQLSTLISALDSFWSCLGGLVAGLRTSRVYARNTGYMGEPLTEIRYDNMWHNFYTASIARLNPNTIIAMKEINVALTRSRNVEIIVANRFLIEFKNILQITAIEPHMIRRLADALFNPLTGDDKPTIVPAVIPWAPKSMTLERVSCIPEGNCLFHAVLKATSSDYRALKTVQERMDFAKGFRNDLVEIVKNKYNELNGKYGLASSGWSKERLIKVLESNCMVGDEVIGILCYVTTVNIHIIQVNDGKSEHDLIYSVVDSVPGNGKVHIVIFQVRHHYELLVERNDRQFTINFEEDHPLIQAINIHKFNTAAEARREFDLKESIKDAAKRDIQVVQTAPAAAQPLLPAATTERKAKGTQPNVISLIPLAQGANGHAARATEVKDSKERKVPLSTGAVAQLVSQREGKSPAPPLPASRPRANQAPGAGTAVTEEPPRPPKVEQPVEPQPAAQPSVPPGPPPAPEQPVLVPAPVQDAVLPPAVPAAQAEKPATGQQLPPGVEILGEDKGTTNATGSDAPDFHDV